MPGRSRLARGPWKDRDRSRSRPFGLLEHAALDRVTEQARRRGLSRREFLYTSSGLAALLLTANELFGCGGNGYVLPDGADLDEDAARARLAGHEFVLDAATQHVSTERPWYREPRALRFLSQAPQSQCGDPHWTVCYSRERFVKEIFLDSDTNLAVLTALPGDERSAPLLLREMDETRALTERLYGSSRLLIHGFVAPNAVPASRLREQLQEHRERHRVSAYKLCPAWGPPGGPGWFLDTDLGFATLEAIAMSGVPLVAVDKGMPVPGMGFAFSSPRDVGPAAKAFDTLTFFVAHAGYDPRHQERAYDRDAAWGADALIASLEAHGVGPNANVYVELGGAWRSVMGTPDQAAHLLGKLLLHVGEDRVLWGTDAICHGCPQDQIEAFRAFEIGEPYQERYGYPALTPERKAKILGLNAARAYRLTPDDLTRALREPELG